MYGYLSTRKQMLELEAVDACQTTRLGQGKFVLFKEEQGDFLFKFRFGHSGRVKNVIGNDNAHFVLPSQPCNTLSAYT